ncbi:hypothetical protein BD560DRAFT_427251 [Blakeslea trispora]|nr:hypothetical protein BD560DRAFT_427251 [Blakeslea trispora]
MVTSSELALVDFPLDKEQHFLSYLCDDGYLETTHAQKEDSLNESIPSLYQSDKTTDTEDEEDDTFCKATKIPVATDSTLVEPYSPQLDFSLMADQDSEAPPLSSQDKQSRFKVVFQRLRGIAMSNSTHQDESDDFAYFDEPYTKRSLVSNHHLNSVVPAGSKPSVFHRSLTDKIKAKFRLREGQYSFQLPRSISSSSMQPLNKKKYSFSNMSRSFSSYYLSPLRQTSHESDPSQPKMVRFAKSPTVNETYSKSEYDRQCDPDAVCARLTPTLAQQIKEELNTFKLYEMQVHEYSRAHTHFFL